MLKNTFCHIPGVGHKSEKRLWEHGVTSWESSLENQLEPNARYSKESFTECITESMERLAEGEATYFSRLLPPREQWRLFPEFRSSTAYLDIETNGFVGPRGYITAISVYDGTEVFTYARGKNLDDFKRDIKKYRVVVTYNGKCFDIPFIESYMGVDMRHMAHIDLRFILRDLGFTGGLKGCEKTLGIDRGELNGVDGYTAVLLWNDFKKNRNEKALETLLAYNILDVVNLEPLAVIAYNRKLGETPFEASHTLSAPAAPKVLPFKPDIKTVERILYQQNRYFTEAFS
ncbi:MAG: exonuclease [Deltaproteobacteria bacterium RBG_19FT_COMBO_58_16]|nr:MAG: exonuclease [Deltaproteobacteria bacterium RBG_19FT_COMBO_58_16]